MNKVLKIVHGKERSRFGDISGLKFSVKDDNLPRQIDSDVISKTERSS